jgi:hypothetical protein
LRRSGNGLKGRDVAPRTSATEWCKWARWFKGQPVRTRVVSEAFVNLEQCAFPEDRAEAVAVVQEVLQHVQCLLLRVPYDDPKSAIVLDRLARCRAVSMNVRGQGPCRAAIAAALTACARCDGVYAWPKRAAMHAVAQAHLHQDCPLFWCRLATDQIGALSRANAIEVANFVWSAATLKLDVGDDLYAALAAAVQRTLPSFNDHNMANVAWALTVLRRRRAAAAGWVECLGGNDVTAEPAIDAALAQGIVSHVHSMSARGVSQSLWSLGRLFPPLSAEQCSLLDAGLARCLPAMTGHDLSMALWAVARLSAYGSAVATAPTLAALKQRALACLAAPVEPVHRRRGGRASETGLSPQGVSNTLWGLTKLFVQFSYEEVVCIEAAAVAALPLANRTEVCAMAWAISHAEARPRT